MRETLFVKSERTLHSIAAVGLRGVSIATGETREGCAGCAGLGNAFYLLVALGRRRAAKEFEMVCLCSVVDERFKRGEGGRDRDVERRDGLAWLALRCASAECGGDEMEQDGAYVGQGAWCQSLLQLCVVWGTCAGLRERPGVGFSRGRRPAAQARRTAVTGAHSQSLPPLKLIAMRSCLDRGRRQRGGVHPHGARCSPEAFYGVVDDAEGFADEGREGGVGGGIVVYVLGDVAVVDGLHGRAQRELHPRKVVCICLSR